MAKRSNIRENLLANITREERRVEIYLKDNRKPTHPVGVIPDTPLESLDLNWTEKELPERERTKHVHRLHPYLGKFIPQLVEVFLRKYFKRGQKILDPFCGSGTTLVQANELGINCIGYDISAFNVLLSRTKTNKYNLSILKNEVMDILNKLKKSIHNKFDYNPELWEIDTPVMETVNETDNEYLTNWYAPQSLKELLTYRRLIETGDYQYKDVMKIILSRSARSSRLTTHFDLDFPKHPQREPYWCYKHSRVCKPVEESLKFIERYTLDTLERIKEFDRLRTDATIEIMHADSRKISIPPIDGVITSPPYVGLIDYHQQHAYAYNLLGLKERRDDEIGSSALGTGIKAKLQYQENIAEVFRNAVRSMSPGGRMIVIANDRSNLYDEIAQKVDVEVEDVVNRHVNRRTGRRASNFYESIFIWRKK